MDFPPELKYTKDHEWARDNAGNMVVGITAFAVEQLGDITLVELPEVGDEVNTGEPFAAVESGKASVELPAPISGTVLQVNEQLVQILQ